MWYGLLWLATVLFGILVMIGHLKLANLLVVCSTRTNLCIIKMTIES